MTNVIHDGKTDLNKITHSLKDILKIKLTRARERHAAAMGFNSYNHLISSIKKQETTSIAFEIYFNSLSEQLEENHHTILTPEQKQSVESLLIEKAELSPTFMEFIKFSLFDSERPLPHIVFCFSQLGIKEGESVCNDLLCSYIEDDVIDVRLADSIKRSISRIRKGMNKLSPYKESLPVSRYEVAKELKKYRDLLLKHNVTNLVNTYYFPMIAISDADEELCIELTAKDVCNAASLDLQTKIYLDSETTDLRQLFADIDSDAEGDEFYDDAREFLTLYQDPDDDDFINDDFLKMVDAPQPKGINTRLINAYEGTIASSIELVPSWLDGSDFLMPKCVWMVSILTSI